ncbi:response regulator transcription factor [Echinicola vietnamensis]|uniref:Response regulator with CheY-like receiver domain and winged-helix DNA-binding domain n=1 Tax=Echinicola vietnamensis (strain DSM 17526 / LMG 23754 / KMM 6221) TaxID=926556 RepID=L0G6C7_ECHVK|nr:response regulator transcription factor [Echinicola vietnamensis]AGA80405.1 response regulator with CheY-like receiver domain and winged-helix DNA-binding domain [Echinicola vietnamensis DSM 17526]
MKLLIVEDEPGIVNFLKQGFEEEGYQVSSALDGDKGLDLAVSDDYDVLLLDWMVPGISGMEICRAFRKINKHTPIIFLTAKDEVADVVFGLQAGANDYIKKPFHFEELLERVKVQLRPLSGEHEVFSIGNIRLDTGTHQVIKGSEEIYLTQKEFSLLEYLLRQKGKVCRRTQIIEHVWDINFDYSTGVIDVYINALRKKLRLDENENYIQTIRGVGYIAKE